ncbi:MAG: hypothetical protein ACYCT1_02960 [Steroidobacteraceae bacterium]
MQALRARNARNSLLLAAVAAAHVLLIALLLHESRFLRLERLRAVPIRAILLLPAHRPRLRFTPGPLRPSVAPVAPLTAPITLILPAVTRTLRAARPINWTSAARAAVHAILNRAKPRAFGFPSGARARTSLRSPPSGIRSQGPESYTTPTGEHVARMGGNCYLQSNPPPIDASSLERGMQMSDTVCSGAAHGPSPDNLFKSLPAYKRYHTLPRRAVHPRPVPQRRKRPVPPGQ